MTSLLILPEAQATEFRWSLSIVNNIPKSDLRVRAVNKMLQTEKLHTLNAIQWLGI